MFFLYKALYNPSTGYSLPESTPVGVDLGIYSHLSYYLGRCNSEVEVESIKQYIVAFIPSDIADGFMLLGREGHLDEDTHTWMPFTEIERDLKSKSLEYLRQIGKKVEVESLLGNTTEVILDLIQRVAYLESIVYPISTPKLPPICSDTNLLTENIYSDRSKKIFNTLYSIQGVNL